MRIFLLFLHAWAIQGSNRLRLQGGNSPCNGRLEVFHENKWGIVCNHKWQKNNDAVICRTMGCGTHRSTEMTYLLIQDIEIAWMNEVNCSGTEENLWNCTFPGWGVSKCNVQIHHVNIMCSENIKPSLTYGCAGAVLISNSKVTGKVCHRNWGKKEADIVCHELDCGESVYIPRSGAFSAEGPTMISSLDCTGQEKYLWQCAKMNTSECFNPVGVICSKYTHFRLVGGKNPCSGNLEVKTDHDVWKPVCQTNYTLSNPNSMCSFLHCGTTGHLDRIACNGSHNITLNCSDTAEVSLMDAKQMKTCFGAVYLNRNGHNQAVCADSWNLTAAAVVCRELGCGEAISVPRGRMVPNGWVSQLECSGQESSLVHCLAKHKPVTGCVEAKVICSDSVGVRLVDGLGKCSGRVEILYEGLWRTVTKQDWSMVHSNVVCNELHCGGAQRFNGGLFSHGDGDVWKLSCGRASSVVECFKKPFPAAVKENIKVICKEQKVLYLQGDSACSGRVEIESEDKSFWLPAPDETWNIKTATVVCRQMQCGQAVSFKSVLNKSQKISDRWNYTYICSSSEKSIFDCPKRLENSTLSGKMAIVNCSGAVSVRLENRCWGKVEVCISGLCGGVCEDAWNPEQSNMLCNDLGCGKSLPLVNVSKTPGVLISSVFCPRSIKHLQQCKFIPINDTINPQYCQNKPIYVVCAASMKAKLQDPREKCSGTVQFFYSGHWRNVCSETLKRSVSNTICSVLGCGTVISNRRLALYKHSNEQGLSDITCSDNTSLASCTVQLLKQTCKPGSVHCSDWARMLLIEDSACKGRVFVLTQGGLQAVSSEGWADKEGQVLCRYLHCGDYRDHQGVNTSLNNWWDHSYNCSGSERKIWDCQEKQRSAGSQQLYIRCTDEPQISLSGVCQGKVTMNMTEGNNDVCGSQWDEAQSQVVCQEMLCSNAISHDIDKNKGKQSQYVSCTGMESKLGQCGTSLALCNRSVIVSCADSVKVKLSQECGGTVQIYYRGIWESVCAFISHSTREANMICSELNCGNAKNHKGSLIIGNKVPETVLKCTRDERFIKHCVSKKSCETGKAAEVYCEKYFLSGTKIPVGVVVGAVLGPFLILIAALILWKRRRAGSCLSSILGRENASIESDDYEEVLTNPNEIEMKKQVPVCHAGVENERGSMASSQSEYDDIDMTTDGSAQPLNKEEDGATGLDQALKNQTNVLTENLVYEEQPSLQEDYDDVTVSPKGEEESGLVQETLLSLGTNTEEDPVPRNEEDYLQPIQ